MNLLLPIYIWPIFRLLVDDVFATVLGKAFIARGFAEYAAEDASTGPLPWVGTVRRRCHA
jgi:hypothetical protein